MKKDKDKKKKASLKQTLKNNVFALKTVHKAAPGYIAIYFITSLLNGALWFLEGGYLIRQVVNGLEQGNDINDTLTFVIVLGVFSVSVSLFLQFMYSLVMPVKYRRVDFYIEKKLFQKASEVELRCYDDPEFYDNYVKAMDEASNRVMSVMDSIANLISGLTSLSATSLLLFVIDPWLIVFGVLPLAFGVFKRLDNVAKHSFDVENKKIKRRINYVKRTYYLNDYAKEMRMGGMYGKMLSDLMGTYRSYVELTKKYGVRRAVYGFLQNFGVEVVCTLGATFYSVWQAMVVGGENGGMYVGDCIVVISSISVISSVLGNLVQRLAKFGEDALYIEDIISFLNYEPKLKGGKETIPEDGGRIRVKNLTFSYPGSDEPALKDIDFVWNKGEKLAVVGSNGSGKTTLVKLLLRLYDPDEGQILIDDTDIRNFTLSSYRGAFTTVFQDFKVFSLTVKENVLLREIKDGDDALVKNALVQSGLYEKVESFEKGTDTVLTREFDDRGEVLSVGQQQKLHLARVFAFNSPFVLLDEPSSALDPVAEYKMFENMLKATENKSVVFISHRLSSAVLADRVIMMEKGRIVECGSHNELMRLNGKYAAMFERQAHNYIGSEGGKDE